MYRFTPLVVLLALTAVLDVHAASRNKAKAGEAVEAADVVSSTGTAETMEGHGTVSVAPTEQQAEEAYQHARQGFLAVAKGSTDTKPGDVVQGNIGVEDSIAGGQAKNIALEDIKIVLDVENVTLREVMTQIVTQAATYTGPWTVKWRLRPENMDLLEERVNLTAEANFGDFCSLLVERVKNMTGTQLFVTAFAGSRMLLVTDTFY